MNIDGTRHQYGVLTIETWYRPITRPTEAVQVCFVYI